MPKKITLDTPHKQVVPVSEYTLVSMLVEYEDGKVGILLRGEGGQLHKVMVDSIPATTQEQAILALINNGVLSGTIGNA